MRKQALILFSILILTLSLSTATTGQQNSVRPRQDKKAHNSEKLYTPLRVTKKPAVLTYLACGNESGTVIFNVTFDKTGKVTNVETLQKSFCSYFDEQAKKAALKIEFKPATENARPITVIKTVDYNWGVTDYRWRTLKYAGNF